ncbi:hypothetical protein PFISCL1PPCAC_11856, partial [Pristionchus fissidentatus]
ENKPTVMEGVMEAVGLKPSPRSKSTLKNANTPQTTPTTSRGGYQPLHHASASGGVRIPPQSQFFSLHELPVLRRDRLQCRLALRLKAQKESAPTAAARVRLCSHAPFQPRSLQPLQRRREQAGAPLLGLLRWEWASRAACGRACAAECS